MSWKASNDIRLYAFLSLIAGSCSANEVEEIDDQTDEQVKPLEQTFEDKVITIEEKFSNLNQLLDEIFYTTREELIFAHRKNQADKPLPSVYDLSPYIRDQTLIPSDPNVKRLSYFVNHPNFFGYSLPEHNRTHFVNICTILWKYPKFVALLQELAKVCKFHPLLGQILEFYAEKDNFQHFNRPYIDPLPLISTVIFKKPDYTINAPKHAEEPEKEGKLDPVEQEESVEAKMQANERDLRVDLKEPPESENSIATQSTEEPREGKELDVDEEDKEEDEDGDVDEEEE